MRISGRVKRLETKRTSGPCPACADVCRSVLMRIGAPIPDGLGTCPRCGRQHCVKVIFLRYPERVPGITWRDPCA